MLNFKPGIEYFINFYLYADGKDPLIKKGYEEARVQIPLQIAEQIEWPDIAGEAKMKYKNKDEWHIFKVNDLEIRFSNKDGFIHSIERSGTEYLSAPLKPNFWRAPTDNDFGNRMEQRCGIWKSVTQDLRLSSLDINTDKEGVMVINSKYTIPVIESIYEIEYLIRWDESIEIRSGFKPGIKGLPELPRFGFTFSMPEGFENIEYYGPGPLENYCDRNTASFVGIYQNTVSNEYFAYIRPQENGYHTGTRWLDISNKQGRSMLVLGSPRFGFSTLHYGINQLDQITKQNYRHTVDLEKSDNTRVNIDLKQMGVGGDNSWGARPHEQYTLPAGEYEFSFIIIAD
jgi:beta-galactosidase